MLFFATHNIHLRTATLAKDTLRFLRKRADCEQRYAKELHSLYQLAKESEPQLNVLGGSLSNAARIALGEAKELCDLHRDFMLAIMEVRKLNQPRVFVVYIQCDSRWRWRWRVRCAEGRHAARGNRAARRGGAR